MDRLIADAEQYARDLRVRRDVRAVCLLGSVARGDPDRYSDVDLLAIIGDEFEPTGRPLRRELPRSIRGHRVQLRILTTSGLAELREHRTMFAAHVAIEGRTIFDRRGDLRRLRRAFPPGSRVEETGLALRKRLEMYQDLRWCNGHYLACLADLYAFGRAGAMLALARRGIFDFGRATPLVHFAAADPTYEQSATAVRRLEPFYLRDRRGLEAALPFPHRDAHSEVRDARNACQDLLSAVP